jgi:competence protein ComEA
LAHEPRQRRLLFVRLFRPSDNSLLNGPVERRPLLTRNDQAAVAAFASIALVFMTISWLASGGVGGELVDIDAVEPLVATFQTDINSADWTELMQLPEIGEALAKRIVESREKVGRFTSHEDLDRVRGIGPKTLERVRPLLRPME